MKKLKSGVVLKAMKLFMIDEANLRIVFELDDDDPYVGVMDQKGYREDVVVFYKGRNFKVNFYYPDRLIQDINTWKEKRNYNFIIEGHLVLQDELDNESIRKRIRKLLAAGYFEDPR